MIARSHYVPLSTPLGDHEIHVTEWGDESSPVLVMWHGLSRNGRDFDTAARFFAGRYRVICPDTIGRGLSSWSRAPEKEYNNFVYVGHAIQLLDALGVKTCAWLGTSMGGLIGMGAASGPLGDRVTHLILNDIGPQVDPISLARIHAYLQDQVVCPTMAEFEDHIRKTHASFGFQTDSEWRHMAETSMRRQNDGRYTSHYDPNIISVFARALASDEPLPSLWNLYDQLAVPTLVVRGEFSDVLPAATAQAMSERGPKAKVVTIAGCGHAPALNTPDQITALDAFLAS